jgi:hypothetical protein
MAGFDTYKDAFSHAKLTRSQEGVLEVEQRPPGKEEANPANRVGAAGASRHTPHVGKHSSPSPAKGTRTH